MSPSWIIRLNICKVTICPQKTYCFYVSPIKIATGIFIEIAELVLNSKLVLKTCNNQSSFKKEYMWRT